MIDIFSKYIEMIETTIDLNRIRNHEYVIKPDYDKDLKGLIENFSLIFKYICF
jgi:DNA mismatch repair protein MSH2